MHGRKSDSTTQIDLELKRKKRGLREHRDILGLLDIHALDWDFITLKSLGKQKDVHGKRVPRKLSISQNKEIV